MTASINFLVIENNETDFLRIKQQLGAAGLPAQCQRASRREELMAALADGRWDVILSDDRVPGLAFPEALALIRQHDAHAPVILVASDLGEKKAVELLRLGISGYVLKDRLFRLPFTVNRVLRDAAEQRARLSAEAALRVSEERYRLAMLGTHDGLWDWNLDTNAVYYSPSWKAMLGYADDELASHLATWQALCHPDDVAPVLAKVKALTAGRTEHFEVEFRLRHKDGQYRDILSRAYLSRDPDASARRLVGTHVDLTERKRAENRLRQAAIVFDNTRDGIIIADRQACILAVNPAFTTITGYSEQEAVGKNMRLLQSGRQDQSFYREFWQALQSTGFWEGEMWNRRKNGDIYLQWLTVNAVTNQEGAYVGVFSDMTGVQHAVEMEKLAHHDALTGLPNRLLLKSRLDLALERSRRRGGQVAVLFLDLDQFKPVNDQLGHQAGDELLRLVADRLRHSLRGEDTVARFGGDEFVVVLDGQALPDDVATVAGKLITALMEPFVLASGHQVHIGTSVGIALYPGDGGSTEELIEHADAALYQAKKAGRGGWCFYQRSE
jgi:diguanylate cyclase (GGDEF)-like protein/PAS domain S-box-containing protein